MSFSHRVIVPGLVMIVVASSACTDEAPSMSTVVRTDSLGIEIVTNTSGDRLLDWEFREVLRLGGTESGAEAFFQLGAAGVQTLGTQTYVLDRGNFRVSVFDADGSHLRSFGGEGDGPGEFRFPTSLAVAPDGRVWVRDALKPAPVAFDSLGSPVDAAELPRGAAQIRYHRTGLIFSQITRDAEAGTQTTSLRWRSGSDSALIASVTNPMSGPLRLESCGLGLPGMPKIFAPVLSWSSRASEVAFTTGTEYEITTNFDGTAARIIRRALHPLAATEELALEELGEGMPIGVGSVGQIRVCDAAEVLEKRGHAAVVPTIAALRLGPNFLWVRREIPGEAPGPIDLFTPDGEYYGTLPEGSPFPDAFLDNDRIIVTEKDELDLDYLVTYRVEAN